MKYNLSQSSEAKEAREYFESLASKGAIVEITQKHKVHSTNQNAYLHLILGMCAVTYGESMHGFKTLIFKGIVNRDLFETEFTNHKTGKIRKSWKSTSELTVDEMRIAIDRLIKFAAIKMDLHLPYSDDYNGLRRIQNEVERNKIYL